MIGIHYWRSRITGKMGHGCVTGFYTNIGLYRSIMTDNYFIPVSQRIREIYNQED